MLTPGASAFNRGRKAICLLLAAAAASLAASCLPFWSPAGAQELAAAADRPPRGSERSLAIPQTAAAPVIDGALDEAAWNVAAQGAQFWISLENRAPSEQTEVLVMADAEHLYFGFRVHDSHPDRISALQTRRDASLGLDDRVTVELDPFRSFDPDATSKFSVNAQGTQQDEIGSGRAQQLAWKGDWKAATARTDYGWSAEIAIPFSILNFELGSNTFSANFYRYHNRTRELSQWADTTPQNRPEEVGRITGIDPPEKAKPHEWTFLPYVFAGKNVREWDGRLRDTKADAGMEIRYEPRPNFTGLLSLNPDLSQIERAVTDINFSYNEKSVADYRPFFREGNLYFGGNDSYYFYSNRIPDFDLGGRSFGRFGQTQFGAFATVSPDDRFDYMGQFSHQFDETHKIGGVFVASDRSAFENTLYAFNGSGREESGLSYAFDHAVTQTRGSQGDGRYTRGKLGWTEDFWSANVTLDEYGRDFFPANGRVDRDLLGTRGGTAATGFYRDFGSGRFYNVQGDAYWQRRYTTDGDLQKDYVGFNSSVELRSEIRASLSYTGGKYRPTAGAPGLWSPTLNSDHYWTAGLDFNTRNDRFSYGVNFSDGVIAEADYQYASAYLRSRPTPVTFLDVSAERLSYFGDYDQIVVTGGWDITPEHNVSARLIHAYYGDSVRAAWTWRVRKNVDLFAVYEAAEGVENTISMKLVFTLS